MAEAVAGDDWRLGTVRAVAKRFERDGKLDRKMRKCVWGGGDAGVY